MDYESTKSFDAHSLPGVRYAIRRMSFERRLELMRKVREVCRELEFRSSGESLEDRLAAAEISSAVEGIYVRWGLHSLDGLTIDGLQADTDTLLSRGPEGLCQEIAAAIRRECGLTDEERKN